MTVYVLIAIVVSGLNNVSVDAEPFQTQEKCIKFSIALKEELEKEYRKVTVDCVKRNLR